MKQLANKPSPSPSIDRPDELLMRLFEWALNGDDTDLASISDAFVQDEIAEQSDDLVQLLLLRVISDRVIRRDLAEKIGIESVSG